MDFLFYYLLSKGERCILKFHFLFEIEIFMKMQQKFFLIYIKNKIDTKS